MAVFTNKTYAPKGSALSTNVEMIITATTGTPFISSGVGYTPLTLTVLLKNPYGTYRYAGSGSGHQISHAVSAPFSYYSGLINFDYNLGSLYVYSNTINVPHKSDGTRTADKIIYTQYLAKKKESTTVEVNVTYSTIPMHSQVTLSAGASTRNSVSFNWATTFPATYLKYSRGDEPHTIAVSGTSGTVVASVPAGADITQLYTVDAFTNGLWSSSAPGDGKHATISLSKLAPATLNMPSVSVGKKTATVSWSTSATVNNVSTSDGGGAISPSTSGSFVISNLNPGTWYSRTITATDAVTGQTSSQSVTFTTLPFKITSCTVKPVYGSSSSLQLDYSLSGSGYYKIEYNINGGSWVTYLNSHIGSSGTLILGGLRSGTTYTVNLRLTSAEAGNAVALGSNSNTTYVVPTHTASAVALSDKTGVKITVSGTLAGHTIKYSGAATGTISLADTNVTISSGQGKTHTFAVTITNNTSGLAVTRNITVSIPALNTAVITGSTSSLSSITLTFNSSIATTKYHITYTANGATYIAEKTVSSATSFQWTSGFANQPTVFQSGSLVTCSVKVWDSAASSYGPSVSRDVRLTTPTSPSLAVNNSITSFHRLPIKITAGNTQVSILGYSINSGAEIPFNASVAAGTVYHLTIDKQQPSTTYTVLIKLQYQYVLSTFTQSVIVSTSAIDTVSSFSISNYIDSNTGITASFTNTTNSAYTRSAVIKYGENVSSPTWKIAGSITSLSSGNTQHTISSTVLQNILKTIRGSKVKFKIELSSTENAYTHPSASSREYVFTIPLSAMALPTVGVIYEAGYKAVIGNKKGLSITNTASPSYGASLVRRTIKIGIKTIETVITSGVGVAYSTPLPNTYIEVSDLNKSPSNDLQDIVVTFEDSRGLVRTVNTTFLYWDYKPVSFSPITAKRINPFSSTVKVDLISINWSQFTTKYANNANNLTSFGYTVNGKAVSPSPSLGTITQSPHEIKDLQLSNTFDVSSSHTVTFTVSDLFSSVPATLTVTIPKGEPLFFIDAENKEIGINTVSPSATLDIKGTIVATNILYFLEEDLVD